MATTDATGKLSSPILVTPTGGISSVGINLKRDNTPVVLLNLIGNTINSPSIIAVNFSNYTEATIGILQIKRSLDTPKFLTLPFEPSNPVRKEVDMTTGGSVVIVSFLFLDGKFAWNFWF